MTNTKVDRKTCFSATFRKEPDQNGTDDTTTTAPTDKTDEDPMEPGAGKRQEDEPFYKKSWIWIIVCFISIAIALPTVVLTAVKYRQRPSDAAIIQQLPLIRVPRGKHEFPY